MLRELTGSSSLARPQFSVIIPTFNRKESLLLTLSSLTTQTLPGNLFEVIVVDDGGSDGTNQVMQPVYPFNLVYCRQRNLGSAAARNYGVSQSHGSILVFIDDDITLDPSYLAAFVDKTSLGVIAMGIWQPYDLPNPTPFSKYIARQVRSTAAGMLENEEATFADCTSNNLVLQRGDFDQVGKWQDVLGDGPTLWGDVEFGYRAWKCGCRFVRVAGARIVHRDQHVVDLLAATKRAYHVSEIVQPLFALHPEIKEYLPMFRDKDPIRWRNDRSSLVVRKLLRQVASSRPALRTMEHAVVPLEGHAPDSKPLASLYRWIVSAYIFQGYRRGLRDLSTSARSPYP